MVVELQPLDQYKEQEIVAEVVYSRMEVNEKYGQQQWTVKMKPLDMDMSNSSTGVLHEWITHSAAKGSKHEYYHTRMVEAIPEAKDWTDYAEYEGHTVVFLQHKRAKAEGGRENEKEMWVPVREATEEDIAQAKKRLEAKLGTNVVQEVQAAKTDGISGEVRDQIREIASGGEGGNPPTELKGQLKAIRQSDLPQDVKQAVMENPGEFIEEAG